MIELNDPFKDNIIKENPWLELIGPVKDLISDVGKAEAARRLKAVYLVYDFRSPLRKASMPVDQIQADIADGVLKKPRFDWSSLEDLIHFWETEMCPPSYGMLNTFRKELEGLKEHIDSLGKWSTNNAKDRVKLVQSYRELMQEYHDIENKVKEEERQGTGGYGNYEPSFLESL